MNALNYDVADSDGDMDDGSPPQFVTRNYSYGDSQDDSFGFPAIPDVCRSSPTPLQISSAAGVNEAEAMLGEAQTERTVKGAPVEFSSLSVRYPLSTGDRCLSHKVDTTSTFAGQGCDADMAQPPPPCVRPAPIPMNRPLTASTLDMSQQDQMTVVMETASSNLSRKTISQERLDQVQPADTVYLNKITKSEQDEMDLLKWSIQKQQFERYAALEQKHQLWGYVDEQNSRVFFHPGTRRAAILSEKRYHDEQYRAAVGKGEILAWYQERQQEFENLVRDFTREETKHKQDLMLARLEKTSPFSTLPILGNRFLLVRLRGKGGNGEVWDVIDYANQKQCCALKLSTSVKHAQREYYTHSKLHHPNIVQVGESALLIEHRQQMYTVFTLERAEADLQHLLEVNETFSEATAVNVLYQLLDALTYLHQEMRIAHYDIKPSNILVTANDQIKLTDFDLTRHVNEPIASSSIGTFRYLPPECFRPKFGNCDGTAEKADIWMVGIVFYLMLVGKHPICSDKMPHEDAKVTLMQFNGDIKYPAGISDVARWICQSCLQPDPRCRPAASQLLVAVRNLLDQHRAEEARQRSSY